MLGLTACELGNYDEAAKQYLVGGQRKPNAAGDFCSGWARHIWGREIQRSCRRYKKATELKADERRLLRQPRRRSVPRQASSTSATPAMPKSCRTRSAQRRDRFQQSRHSTRRELTRGQDKEAIEALQRSIKQNPKGADSYYQLGLVYMKTPATMADSVTQFEKYLQLAPKGEYSATAKELVAITKSSVPAR